MLPAGLSRTIGLFVEHEENTNECLKNIVDHEDLLGDDPYFKSARSMMILSLVGAFCAGCMVMFEFFCCRVCCAVLLENIAYLSSIAMGALVFLAYHNPYCDTIEEKFDESIEEKAIVTQQNEMFECTLGQGSVYHICAIGLYAVAMAVLCCSPKPTPLISQLSK